MDHLLYNRKTNRQCIQLASAVPSACNLVTTTFLPRRGLKLLLLVYCPMVLIIIAIIMIIIFLIWIERYNLQAPLHVVEHLYLTVRLQPRYYYLSFSTWENWGTQEVWYVTKVPKASVKQLSHKPFCVKKWVMLGKTDDDSSYIQ